VVPSADVLRNSQAGGVSPLQVVQEAGMFGMTLAWYDLQALTTYFDGQEPVISGQIDWPYLQNAAIEIFDCPPGEAPASNRTAPRPESD
jgi:hypothetical protein